MTLDADELETAARDETGLGDFGDGLHREGLERLVASMNEEGDLTETGRADLPGASRHRRAGR